MTQPRYERADLGNVEGDRREEGLDGLAPDLLTHVEKWWLAQSGVCFELWDGRRVSLSPPC